MSWERLVGTVAALVILLAAAGVARAQVVTWDHDFGADDFDTNGDFELDDVWEDPYDHVPDYHQELLDAQSAATVHATAPELAADGDYLEMTTMGYLQDRSLGTVSTFSLLRGRVEVDFKTGPEKPLYGPGDTEGLSRHCSSLMLYLMNESGDAYAISLQRGGHNGAEPFVATWTPSGWYQAWDATWSYDTEYRLVIEWDEDETTASFRDPDDTVRWSKTWQTSAGDLGAFHVVLAQGVYYNYPSNLVANALVDSVHVTGTELPPPTTPTGTLPDWTAGRAYTRTLTTTYGALDLEWEVTGLPPGLAQDDPTGRTLTITGTPTTAGTYAVTAEVTDATGSTASEDFTITIHAPPTTPGGTLPDWTVGRSYGEWSVQTTGGTGPFTWTVTGLPDGLTADGSTTRTLTFSGTPTQTGTWSAEATATDSTGATASRTFPITVHEPVTTPTGALPDWVIGRTYGMHSFTTTGGVGPYSWSVSGLPAGLAGDGSTSDTLTISGSATESGTFVVGVGVMDATGSFAGTSLILTISPPVSAPTGALPDWTVGQTYDSSTLATTGGALDMDWEVTGLPPGLVHDASPTRTLTVTGTPTSTGTYTVTVDVTGAAGTTASEDFTLTINPALEGPTGALHDWTSGRVYGTATLTVTGGTAPVAWEVTGLPVGLTATPSERDLTIAGTPLHAGSYSVMVTVTDAAGSQAGPASFPVTVHPPVTAPAGSLAEWTVGRPYPASALTTTGGTGPFTWEVTDLPAGLVDDGSTTETVTISGTPTVTGRHTVTVTVTDLAGSTASTDVTLVVNAPLGSPVGVLPAWTIGMHYGERTFSVGDGTEPVGWAVTGLPAGLGHRVEPGSGRTLTITGTPTETGTFSVALTSTDAAGSSQGPKTWPLTINPAPTAPLGDLPPWTVDRPYPDSTFTTTAGTAPIAFSVTGLPSGLGHQTANRTLTVSGTPLTSGRFHVTLTVTDTAGARADRDVALIVNDRVGAVWDELPDWTEGRPYEKRVFWATGGTSPIDFTVTSLPPGLVDTSFDRTLVVSGTPTTAGSYTATIEITDAAGSTTSRPFPIVIHDPLTRPEGDLPAWTVGMSYGTRVLTTTGGTEPIEWEVTGLPPGLLATPENRECRINGIPTAAGLYVVLATVRDAAGDRKSSSWVLTVNAAPAVTGTLPDWTVGQSFGPHVFEVTGGTDPLDFTVTGLPPGVSADPESRRITLSGGPTSRGTYDVSVRVTDGAGAEDRLDLTVVISDPVAIDTADFPAWTVHRPYTRKLTLRDGTAPYEWEMTSGGPAGLSFDAGSATYSGTPTTPGAFMVRFRVRDAAGSEDEREYELVVNAEMTLPSKTLLYASTGTEYEESVARSGGTAPFMFEVVSGDLPVWVDLDRATGALTGTPTAPGFHAFSVTVTDAAGAVTEPRAYDLWVADLVRIDTKAEVAFSVPAEQEGRCLLAFDALRECKLSMKLRRPDKQSLSAAGGSLLLARADGTPVTFLKAPKVKWSRKALSLKGCVPAETGRFYLLLTDLSTEGFEAAVKSKLKVQRRFKGEVALRAGVVTPFGFAAPVGTTGTIVVKPAKGSSLVAPEFTRVFHVETGATVVDLTGGTKLELPSLTAWGEYAVEMTDGSAPDGRVRFAVKLKTPKPGK